MKSQYYFEVKEIYSRERFLNSVINNVLVSYKTKLKIEALCLSLRNLKEEEQNRR